MMLNDAISYVWSENFVNQLKISNERILSTSSDVKFERIKVAVLRQLVGSCGEIEGGVLSKKLINDFRWELDGLFEQQILKWISFINYEEEVSTFQYINYSQVPPTFNASKFYNFLQSKSLDEVIYRYSNNIALFTELIYYKQFFDKKTSRRITLTASLLYKKLIVFATVWVEKAKENKTSPITKKLAEVVASVKMYSIVLSLPITTARKMFGFFHLFPKKGVETHYEVLVANDTHYTTLHDFMYKNCIIQMHDYENSVSKSIALKEFVTSYCVKEISDLIYDKDGNVFNDTTVYEKLHSQDHGASLMTEVELFKGASRWFIDLTRAQQKEIIPLLIVHTGGVDEVNTFRHNGDWFVNGGVKDESASVSEWLIWRRYITLLTVKHLESIVEEGENIEVSCNSILLFIIVYFIYRMCDYDFDDLQTLLLECDNGVQNDQLFSTSTLDEVLSDDSDLDFLLEEQPSAVEDPFQNLVVEDLFTTDFLEVNPIQISEEEYQTMEVLNDEISLECVEEMPPESNNTENNSEDCSESEKMFANKQFRDTCDALRKENETFKVKNQALIKKMATERSAKLHQKNAMKIEFVYRSLPETYILHNSFARITKFQKLDQVHKFIENVLRHGYRTNK